MVLYLKFIIGRQWCDSLFSTHWVFFCFSQLCCIEKGHFSMQTYSFLVVLAGTLLAIAFLGFSIISTTFFVLFFFFVVQMILQTDKGTNSASVLTPTYLRLLVNQFGLHTIFTVAWPSPTGQFLILIDSLTIYFSRHSQHCEVGSWSWASRLVSPPWVLHSRRRWPECVGVCMCVCMHLRDGSNLRHLFDFFKLIGWLSKSSWLSQKMSKKAGS